MATKVHIVESLGGVPAMTGGTDAGRPAAGTLPIGTLYVASDTRRIYRTDGASWSLFATATIDDLTGTVTTAQLEDGAVTDMKAGSRTVDQTLAAPADAGMLTSLLSWIAGRIREVKGTADWKTAPRTTLLDALNRTGDSMTGPLTLAGDPVGALEAATRQYTDAARSGLDAKQSVRVSAVAPQDVAVGGLLTLDGVALASGDRVLLLAQTAASENGIWIAQIGAWTRAPDADTSEKVTSGMFVFVSEGTARADTGWLLQTNDPITLGTTPLTFVQFSSAGVISAGAGLAKNGNILSVAPLGVTDAMVAAANKDGAAATPSLRTLGTGAAQAAPGDHNHDAVYPRGNPAAPADGQVWTYDAVSGGWLPRAPAGAAPADMLLLSPVEVAVSAATVLAASAAGKMHALSGGGYTVTLPSAVGNGGKLIGFRVVAAATGIVTLAGSGAETIDGSATRAMWAGDSLLLLSDGANWASAAGARPATNRLFGGFVAYRSASAQALTGAAYNDLIFNTEEFDLNNYYDPATGIYTPLRAGYYRLGACALVQLPSVGQTYQLRIYKNGTPVRNIARVLQVTANAYISASGNALVYANGTTDYFQANLYVGGACSMLNTQTESYFMGEYAGGP